MKKCNPTTLQTNGMVLIYVLGLIALISGVLAMFTAQTQQLTKRLDMVFRDTDARYMSFSALNLTQHLLDEDAKSNSVDGVGDTWYRYQEQQEFPIEGGGTIAMRLFDLNTYPNINEIKSGMTVKDLLFQAMMKDYFSSARLPYYRIGVLTDWIDADNYPSVGGGAEQSIYSGYTPPRIIANRKIISPQEFYIIHGISPKEAEIFINRVSFYGNLQDINVNTASPAFLKAVFNTPEVNVGKIIRSRKRSSYTLKSEFYDDLGVVVEPRGLNIGFTSNTFKLWSDVTINGKTKSLEAVIDRSRGRSKIRSLIWQ